MTPKEFENDKVIENLEEIILYFKDVTSYLENINDTLGEILDLVQDYEPPHGRYAYELGGDNDDC